MIDTKVLEKLARLDDATILRRLPDSERTFFEYGFQRGYNRALKDLWHPASEEPKPNDSYILYEYKPDEGKSSFRFRTEIICEYVNWEAFVSAENITRWLYIDDLLPKEGGEQ